MTSRPVQIIIIIIITKVKKLQSGWETTSLSYSYGFFLKVHVKDVLYRTPFNSGNNFVAHLYAGVLSTLWYRIKYRYSLNGARAYLELRGGHFEQLYLCIYGLMWKYPIPLCVKTFLLQRKWRHLIGYSGGCLKSDTASRGRFILPNTTNSKRLPSSVKDIYSSYHREIIFLTL